MTRIASQLLIILIFATNAAADGISVSQSLDKPDIDFTDSVTLEITLQWDGPQTAYLFDRHLSPVMTGLKVKRFASSIGSSVRAGNEVTTKQYLFVLEPTTSGLATIEPVTIDYVSWPDSLPGRLITGALTVTIALRRIETKPETSLWWAWVLGGLVLAIGAAIGIPAFIRRSRPAVTLDKSPRDELLDSLSEARARARGDLKRFQNDVHKILVAFLRNQYNIDAMKLEPDAVSAQLKSAGVAAEKADKVCEWLVKAQKDKYSPVTGSPGEAVRLQTELAEFFERF